MVELQSSQGSLSLCRICSRTSPGLQPSDPANWWSCGKEPQFSCQSERQDMEWSWDGTRMEKTTGSHVKHTFKFNYKLFWIKVIWFIASVLPVPCCEGASLGRDAEGLYLTHLHSCICIMSPCTDIKMFIRRNRKRVLKLGLCMLLWTDTNLPYQPMSCSGIDAFIYEAVSEMKELAPHCIFQHVMWYNSFHQMAICHRACVTPRNINQTLSNPSVWLWIDATPLTGATVPCTAPLTTSTNPVHSASGSISTYVTSGYKGTTWAKYEQNKTNKDKEFVYTVCC